MSTPEFLAAVQKAKEIAARLRAQAAVSKRSNEDGDEDKESGDKRRREDDHPPPRHDMPMGMAAPSEIYEIPNSCAAKVIGRNGETVNGMQRQSGCKIQISPDTGSERRKIQLYGTKDAIETAKRLLAEAVREAQGGIMPALAIMTPQTSTLKTLQMMIPANRVGLVIGKNGETIKMLQDKTGAKIQMIQDGEFTFALEKPLRISGEERCIRHAEQLIRDMLSEKVESEMIGGGSLTSGDIALDLNAFKSVKIQMPVPRAAVGSVIGRNGETIKRIQAETGARMQFDPDDGGQFRMANLSGTAEMVKRGEEYIKNLIDEAMRRSGDRAPRAIAAPSAAAPMTSTAQMSVPANRCGVVIGRGGENIKQIMQSTGAHIELVRDTPPDAETKVFNISGTQTQIEAAQAFIRNKIESRTLLPGRPSGVTGSSPAPGFGMPLMGGYPPPPGAFMPGYPPPPGFPGPFPPYATMYGGGAAAAAAAAAAAPPPPPPPEPPKDAQMSLEALEALAVSKGFPTEEQYQANKDWYNKQGYFGVQSLAAMQQTGSAAPAATAGSGPPPSAAGQGAYGSY